MKLIDKDALVAEIERRIESCAKQREDMLNVQCHTLADDASARIGELNCIQDFINTLEVKEVDLTDEASIRNELVNYLGSYGSRDFAVAKHFFELGVNTSNPLTWKDIADILDVTDVIANDDSMEERLKTMSEEEYCQEVLKRFKAQKGEKV